MVPDTHLPLIEAAIPASARSGCRKARSGFETNQAISGVGAVQVAERSLFLWNNEYLVSLVAQQRHVVLPLVFPALERNARSHWNPAVHGLTFNVRSQ